MIELLLAAERMLTLGLLDRAEHLFAQVAQADPKNAIAVTGLARVALERGDEASALEMARRALAIDPQDDAARRLVERLEEVIATRERAAVVQTPARREPPPTAATIAAAPVTSAETPNRRSWLRRLSAWLQRPWR